MPNPPTLINLPPPPSDPVTPSDIPGTPNSTTTSMSELSTVAIKDGHRGHLPHGRQLPNPDAERADRISRLAGLERVATTGRPSSNLTPGSAAHHPYSGTSAPNSSMGGAHGTGYFDAAGNPLMGRERSTVGSASATGSVGGRTTWASGSASGEGEDRGTSEQDGEGDVEMESSSVGGMSEDAGSLVGFGEGARTPARGSAYGSPAVGKRESVTPVAYGGVEREVRDARMIDGLSREGPGQVAERIVRERIGDDGGLVDGGGSGLGKFEFEGK